jgi:hypothetical protein
MSATVGLEEKRRRSEAVVMEVEIEGPEKDTTPAALQK